MNERTLLLRLRDGDVEALGEIIERYTPYLFAIASNILAHVMTREDAEEIVSDSFTALWRHRTEVLPGKLRPWLAAVARNKARDALRSVKAEEPLDDDLLEIAACDDTERELLLAEFSEITRQAVDSLGEPEREIFRRHYYLYQKTDEIAAALDMNSATVRTKLKRGRERLKDYFTERGYSYADPNL